MTRHQKDDTYLKVAVICLVIGVAFLILSMLLNLVNILTS